MFIQRVRQSWSPFCNAASARITSHSGEKSLHGFGTLPYSPCWPSRKASARVKPRRFILDLLRSSRNPGIRHTRCCIIHATCILCITACNCAKERRTIHLVILSRNAPKRRSVVKTKNNMDIQDRQDKTLLVVAFYAAYRKTDCSAKGHTNNYASNT